MLNKKLKIAIYSGSIPGTTFIENLIKGVAIEHTVFLFGKQKKNVVYASSAIHTFPIYSNDLLNALISLIRTILLSIKYPKRVAILFQKIRPLKGRSAKFNWWVRFVPVLLHLPDIFHIQWAKDIEHWFFLKEKLGCKIVLSLRGAHINYSPLANPKLAATYKKYFPKTDGFHAVSNAIGLEAQKYGAEPYKIRTIHSIIYQSTYELFKLPVKEKIEKLRIISVGRHHWKKGYNVALDACKLLKEQNIPFGYNIIAEGKVPEELLFQKHQLDLLEEVGFLGSLPQKEVFRKIQESDVLLLPSLEEGIANVVLEAMALGVPVISTDCGGMPEVVKHNKTGWLVPALDSGAIAEAFEDVYNSSLVKRQEITKNAHEFVKEQFNAERSIEKFNELYEMVYRNN